MGDGQTASDSDAGLPFVSLYRRFRPGRFSELRGQDYVVLALQSAVRQEHVAHAYLFSGPRGTGKTSTARILARALNCANPQDGEPCGVCPSCIEIARGASLDVHELDAASNNGVDAMRDLVAHAALSTPGRWKIYIVDEVHMLSTAAANALLKTLEEPPSHVVFVLATTDPQKVPATIRSRTQHFEFRLLGGDTLLDLLKEVKERADLSIDEDDLAAVVRRARGSARDALSALDQVIASGSSGDVRPELAEVIEAICEHDAPRALVAVAALHEAGWGTTQLIAELIDELRQAFLVALAPELAGASEADHEALSSQADRLGLPLLVRSIEVLGQVQVDLREAPDPRVVLEVALARLARPELDDSPGALAERLARLERAVAAGGTARTTSEAPPPPPQVPRSSKSPAGETDPTVRPSLGAIKRERSSATPVPSPQAVETPDDPPIEQIANGHSAEASVGGGEPPDRDALVEAWGDHILRTLPAKAKALYGAGRFISVSGATATFALPNAAHRDRCDAVRPVVEKAIAGHFGTAVGLDLTVEGTSPPSGAFTASRAVTAPQESAERESEDEEVFDPDAPHEAIESLAEARVKEAFPGIEEVPG